MISNHRIYANPLSVETSLFEHRLEEAGIPFYRHDPGITWTDNTTPFLGSSIVYTFDEEYFALAQAIMDQIRKEL